MLIPEQFAESVILSVESDHILKTFGFFPQMDELAVYIERPEETLGFTREAPDRTLVEHNDRRMAFYPLPLFLLEAAHGNLTLLEAFFTGPTLGGSENLEDVRYELRLMGPDLVSRWVIPKIRYQISELADSVVNKQTKAGDKHIYDGDMATLATISSMMALQLMETRTIDRADPRWQDDFLEDLIHGEVPLEDWREDISVKDATLANFNHQEQIPRMPDLQRIDSWCINHQLAFHCANFLDQAG